MMRVYVHKSLRKRIKDQAQLRDLTISELIAECVDRQLRADSATAEADAEIRRLKAEVSRLSDENTRLRADDIDNRKLILRKLDSLPRQIAVQAGGRPQSFADESDVPDFIPTFPVPVSQHMGKPRTNVVEHTGETAADALRRFRASQKAKAEPKKDNP